MRPANKRRCYIVTSSLIGLVHTQNDPCLYVPVDTESADDLAQSSANTYAATAIIIFVTVSIHLFFFKFKAIISQHITLKSYGFLVALDVYSC